MNAFYDFYRRNPSELHFCSDNLIGIKSYTNSLILDLYDIFVSICYHDFYTKRDEYIDNSRRLELTVPVYNYEKLLAVLPLINDLVRYMTNGELWNVKLSFSKKIKSIISDKYDSENKEYDNLCLLSGGLDAFSGSIIEKNNKTIYVTTETNNTEVLNAKRIYENVLKNDDNVHVVIKKLQLERNGQYTQRTRTLFFLANSFIYADFYKINKIKMYENGVMSLNPTFFFRRFVTKTTHPKTIYLINRILNSLEIDFKVENPFMYFTKCEVIEKIPSKYLDYIKDTKTCSKHQGIPHFSNRRSGENHCGVCTACILRQISILNAKYMNLDVMYMVPYNISLFDDFLKYEKNIAKNDNYMKIKKSANYKYIEKKSLLEYYKTYSSLIEEGKIYKYLDLHPKYFEDIDYYANIEKMLKKFKKEIDVYIGEMT